MTAFHPLCHKRWSNVFNSLHSLFIVAWTPSQISLCLINLFSLFILQSNSHPYIQSTVALRFQKTDVAGQLALELLSWYQKELRNPRILWDRTPNVDENRLYWLIAFFFPPCTQRSWCCQFQPSEFRCIILIKPLSDNNVKLSDM